MHLTDTHVHIDHYPNPQKVAEAYERLKIYTLFVTNLPELFEANYSSYQNYKYIRLCLGFHPQLASEFPFDELLFNKLINKTKYIGEVGLDFLNEHNEIKNKQVNIFDYITSPKFNKGRIYTIHSRNSEEQVLEILVQNKVKHAIFHWYSGNLLTLEKILERGYYFSLNPKMLKTKNGLKVIERLPHDRILFETDGPFSRYNKEVIGPTSIEKSYKDFSRIIPYFEKNVYKNFRRILIERDLY
ncbi:TatD-related deoxyribonuclease [Niallia circulans]|uniref:TatD family hydrolase n=1 Tax=Shouchella clausii TaxID=79880 RepID=UPI000D8F5FBC|nr:TatD family hydrolase [Shouchella clausii]MCM3549919.1 TatD family hydrolase [Shouchella clausii]SPU21006.1 TatD-related deoxyribonuclease [Niallia circulans]